MDDTIEPVTERILIVDDNPVVAKGLSILLNDGTRMIFSARDFATAELILEHEGIDLVLSDIRLTGDYSFEGLDFVDHVRNFSPDVRVLLMTGAGDDQMEQEAIRRGAIGMLRKPFELSELIDYLEPSTLTNGTVHLLPTLDEVLQEGGLKNVFQPIFKLGAVGEVPKQIGSEALARATTDTLFSNPEFLFRYADKVRRTHELETHCTRISLSDWFRLKQEGLLFNNLHPLTLSSRNFASRIISMSRAPVDLSRVVFEITEQGPLDCSAAETNVNELREAGARFAFDDVGVAFSHLPCLDRIKPDWMKISQVFGTGFEQSSTKSLIIQNIMNLASTAGAELIIEGIETQETLDAAQKLGIGYGQGFFLGRPNPLSETLAS